MEPQKSKIRAPRNKTLAISVDEADSLIGETIIITEPVSVDALNENVIHQDTFECLEHLPDKFIDLLIVDPPYNMNKTFSKTKFMKTNLNSYEQWFDSWVEKLVRCLRPDASVYICCDWQSSSTVQSVLQKYFIVRNRITWEREKGRGAKENWKNCSEDIWFCTMNDDYHFDVDAVKLKRKVIAPYRNTSGTPKDWKKTESGNFRLTHPSNLWTDISIPFWSMSENTDHPTQKPEKLIAKLILASSKKGDFVFDPFLGSGTTCVAAKKLGRKFCGIEMETEYCQMAVKRLREAKSGSKIQGYHDSCFWERNSLAEQKAKTSKSRKLESMGLFDE